MAKFIAIALTLFALMLVYINGLNRSSYWGLEIPFFLIAVGVASWILHKYRHIISSLSSNLQALLFTFGGGILCMAIYGALDGLREFRINLALDNALTTNGKIVYFGERFDFSTFNEMKNVNRDQLCHIFYRYTVNNTPYTQSHILPYTCKQIKSGIDGFPYQAGDSVDIEFLAVNPTISRIAGYDLDTLNSAK